MPADEHVIPPTSHVDGDALLPPAIAQAVRAMQDRLQAMPSDQPLSQTPPHGSAASPDQLATDLRQILIQLL